MQLIYGLPVLLIEIVEHNAASERSWF